MANESKSGFKQEGLDLHQKTGDDEITQGRESSPIDILLLSIAGIFLVLGVTNIVITASRIQRTFEERVSRKESLRMARYGLTWIPLPTAPVPGTPPRVSADAG